MFFSLVLFFVGFFILIKGAQILIDGATSLGLRLRISSILIGLLIAGIGTSIPEFAISLWANLVRESDLTLGVLIGSTTMNNLFILGISALFFPLSFQRAWVHRDLLWSIAAGSLFLFFVFVPLFGEGWTLMISSYEGFLLMLLFWVWFGFVLKVANNTSEEVLEGIRIVTVPIAFIMVVVGLIGVIGGGKWVVDGAKVIALHLGASEALVGFTVLSIGTSIPELAVSFVAAYKKRMGIAVGNIIGSNIFNFLMIAGVAALIRPILFPIHFLIDVLIALGSAVLLFAAMFIGIQYTLKRWQGIAFVLLYIGYLAFLFIRG